MDKKLLILDIDETLLFATSEPLSQKKVDFMVGPYSIYLRPFLYEFLAEASQNYRIALWTASSESYAHRIVEQIFKNRFELEFIWARKRCTLRFDPIHYEYFYLKNLKKLKRRGELLEQIIMVDNTPRKLMKNYGNLVAIPSFEGESDDEALLYLSHYLRILANASNVRVIDKRGWITKVKNQQADNLAQEK
ncbi:HAD family hydrolase [Pleionea sp. CnH1-48]|uniref:HAD family hydrolase n=1 Tax=Pleionea sp. CnH1-48 TaxID=2954494 RepID=UPI002097C83B|nr:HAD family hydrolase [Pleionea sp. CnH1-48]MCO7225819.1 HAD family hydrolase [Pleionea sp. CnH1-48]